MTYFAQGRMAYKEGLTVNPYNVRVEGYAWVDWNAGFKFAQLHA